MNIEHNGYTFTVRTIAELSCHFLIQSGSDAFDWIKENAQFTHKVFEIDGEITGEEFILAIPKEDDNGVNNLRDAYGDCPAQVWDMLCSASAVGHKLNPDDPGFVLFLLN